jgi:hypothetical protein
VTGRLGAQQAKRGMWMIAIVGANPQEPLPLYAVQAVGLHS